jgi:hypothetical protein
MLILVVTTNWLHGDEPFSGSRQLCSYSTIFHHLMQPESSLSCSQEPFFGPYLEPDQSSPKPHSLRSISIQSTHLCLGLPSGFLLFFPLIPFIYDRLCGLVVRVVGYKSGGPGSIPSTNRKKVVDLERGPLSLVSTTEELLDRKVAATV